MRPLKEELRDRRLPELMMTQRGEPVVSSLLWEKRRAELLKIMAREEFGFSPEPVPASGRVADGSIKEAYGGKAVEKRFVVTFPTPKGDFSFPLYLAIPSAGQPCPCILLLNFRKQIPDEYYPVEEILDAGFATACIYYQDITSDDGNMEDGLAGCFSLSQAGETGMGKIGCWAYAMSRAVDLLLEQPEIRKNAIVTAGHSRLGKTSLWCAAQDQRIAGCISNNAGCSGDAITRGKAERHVVDLPRISLFGLQHPISAIESGKRTCLLISISFWPPLRPVLWQSERRRRTNGLIRSLRCWGAWRLLRPGGCWEERRLQSLMKCCGQGMPYRMDGLGFIFVQEAIFSAVGTGSSILLFLQNVLICRKEAVRTKTKDKGEEMI